MIKLFNNLRQAGSASRFLSKVHRCSWLRWNLFEDNQISPGKNKALPVCISSLTNLTDGWAVLDKMCKSGNILIFIQIRQSLHISMGVSFNFDLSFYFKFLEQIKLQIYSGHVKRYEMSFGSDFRSIGFWTQKYMRLNMKLVDLKSSLAWRSAHSLLIKSSGW